MSRRIRVAIAGVGNCASSLVQGIEYYRDAHPGDTVPRHVRRDHAEHLAPPATNLTVKEQHVGRCHLDHDLPRPGDRISNPGDLQHLRPAIPVHLNRSHDS